MRRNHNRGNASTNKSKYDAVPFVKNDPVELGRLGRLVPRFTKSSTVGERMARVRFLQMVQLIQVISVGTRKEEYLRRHSFYQKIFTGLNRSIWHFIREKKRFSVQMVRAPCLRRGSRVLFLVLVLASHVWTGLNCKLHLDQVISSRRIFIYDFLPQRKYFHTSVCVNV